MEWDIILNEYFVEGSPVEDAFTYLNSCGGHVDDTGTFYRFLLNVLGVDLSDREGLDRLSFMEQRGGLELMSLFVTQCFHDGGVYGKSMYIIVSKDNGMPAADNYLFRMPDPVAWCDFQPSWSWEKWAELCDRVRYFVFSTIYDPTYKTTHEKKLFWVTNPPGAKGHYLLRIGD